MWARMDTGVSPGHLVLHGRAPPVKGGAAVPEGGQEWGPTRAFTPHYQDETHKEDYEMMTPTTATLLRTGRPISGCWWLATCLKEGYKDSANWPWE